MANFTKGTARLSGAAKALGKAVLTSEQASDMDERYEAAEEQEKARM